MAKNKADHRRPSPQSVGIGGRRGLPVLLLPRLASLAVLIILESQFALCGIGADPGSLPLWNWRHRNLQRGVESRKELEGRGHGGKLDDLRQTKVHVHLGEGSVVDVVARAVQQTGVAEAGLFLLRERAGLEGVQAGHLLRRGAYFVFF